MAPEIDAQAPDFDLPNRYGEQVRLSDFRGRRPVVLVFFPLAFTGTCTGELCELRDNLALFEDRGVELIAISVDSKASLAAWAEQEGYRFTLLSDFWPHGAVAREYGAFVEEAGIATRATVIIGKDRKVLASFETSPGEARDFTAYREAVSAL